MKKLLFVMVLLMGVLVVNAQMDTTKVKTTTTTMSAQQAVRTPVKPADLLKPITDNVAKDYAGYSIKEATSVKVNNTVTYEVVLFKGVESVTLVYDKDGNFLKKLEM
jgi:hypothetical protein